MKIVEHVELRNLSMQKPRKIRKPDQIAELCVTCKGQCKAPAGLYKCPARDKWNKG